MLYTGRGDGGYTRVIGGPALLKCDPRLEALGALDEAQAHLGLARALLGSTPWSAAIHRVQSDLRLLMAEIATVSRDAPGRYLTAESLQALERDLADWDARTGGWHGFTSPGETVPGAHLHLARTVIRRAERQMVAFCRDGGVANPLTLSYLNRLSSWVYALALQAETASSGTAA
jgi:cob(I)alamin adenosyltransferase